MKLLVSHNLLDGSITMGVERGYHFPLFFPLILNIPLIFRDFDFVFDLCRFGAAPRLPFVNHRYAEFLEAEGNFDRAEEFFLKAGKQREAVLMHLQNKNWDAAERISKYHIY